jgi:hypothetical protein
VVIYLSLLVALVGALMYAFSANPKLAMIGIVSYGAGLLAFLLRIAIPLKVVGG